MNTDAEVVKTVVGRFDGLSRSSQGEAQEMSNKRSCEIVLCCVPHSDASRADLLRPVLRDYVEQRSVTVDETYLINGLVPAFV